MKPKVIVTYYADQLPDVRFDPPDFKDGIDVEVVDGDEQAMLFLEYEKVRIYHTIYKSGCLAQHIYSTECDVHSEVGYSEGNAEAQFDERDLPEIPADESSLYLNLFPDEEIRQKMAYAIDQGWLHQDGLDLRGVDK